MTSKLRRIKTYTPRKRRTKIEMERQRLMDMQHSISAMTGRMLVLLKEGSRDQAASIQAQVKSDFLKTAPQMQHLAAHLGGHLSVAVQKYLDSVSALLHSSELCMDPALIDQCYVLEQAVMKHLKAA